MCETCITKLHGTNAFIGQVPKLEELIPWDADPKERESLEELQTLMRIAWVNYTAGLMAFAGDHVQKERKNARAPEPVDETNLPEELQEPDEDLIDETEAA